jgi:hypothetical protein
MPKNYPTIVIGDFNIDMLKKTPQSTTFQNLMYKYKLKFIYKKNTTINNTQKTIFGLMRQHNNVI